MKDHTSYPSLDKVIERAVNESYSRTLEAEPSDEALASEYPPNTKSLKAVRKYLFFKRLASSAFKRGASIVAAVLALFIITTPLTGAASAQDYNNIRRLFSKHPQFNAYDFDLITDLPETEKELYDLEIGYIPEGYELQYKHEDEVVRNYIYYAVGDQNVSIYIAVPEGTSVRVDNEHTVHETLTINGLMADLYYDNADRSGSIIIATANYIMDINGCLTDKEEIIKIAENIKEKDSNGKEE